MSGEMNKSLPEGWRWVKLGEVCELYQPQTISFEEMVKNPGSYPVFGANGLIGTYFKFNHVDPEILITCRGATCGTINISPPHCWVTGNAMVARPIGEAILHKEYLFWSLHGSDLSGAIAGAAQPQITRQSLAPIEIPLPPLPEQKRIAAILNEKMAAVEKARAAAEAQLEAAIKLQYAYVQETLKYQLKSYSVGDCFTEVSTGIGSTWSEYPLLGATRFGLAPAKEPVGSRPERYKLADIGTIFYNPMRILIGSIALVDVGDRVGITSPDYVVIKAKEGILHYRWFYYWFRSSHGERFIKSLARGAVRERILFNRLIQGSIDLPPYESQCIAAENIAKIRPLLMGIEEKLNHINALPAAILHKAFSGGF